MQGTFLPLHWLTRVAFKLDASNSFIVASCVIESGLEVETFREAMCGCSSLGCRARVDRIVTMYLFIFCILQEHHILISTNFHMKIDIFFLSHIFFLI